MKDRIKQLMESQHMNQQSFASFIGLAPATLSSILQERTRPTLNTVEAICKKLPSVNLTWLMTGNGEMFTTSESKASDSVDHNQPANNGSSGMASNGAPLAFEFADDSHVSSTPMSGHQNSVKPQPATRMQTQYVQTKNIDKPQRRITEIRVFYDDQTWESFVPKR